MFEVREINPEMTYNLRRTILRPHQAIESSKSVTDHEDHAFHVGVFYQGKLISVASFIADNNPDFPIEKQYRLRQMATHAEFRKLGAGRAVVHYAEQVIKAKGVNLLWCKGRTTVQEYYRTLGFQEHGDVFDYPPIGPHIVMVKELV